MKKAIEFKPILQCDDNWAVELLIDGEQHGYVKWVESEGGHVCRVNRLEFAWSSSKSQATAAATYLNEEYKEGRIK